ncbi:MAG: phosphate signaling complex protein PhoU [Spirochaetes bacterium]|nr:phosphate signaling complex protein PhoU [Spirochaetota bacterium]
MTTRIVYEQKLNGIYQEVVEMGRILIDSLKKVAIMIDTEDLSLMDPIKENEERLNKLELSLEDQFIVFIATEAPVAHDLRKIVSSIKIVSHLERMGDYALHIGKKYVKSNPKFLQLLRPRLIRMIHTLIQMLEGTLEAYTKNDVIKAEQTATLDDEIDTEHKKFLNDVFQQLSLPGNEKEFARALNLGRSIERLGDHITNICEWIVYAEQFRHVELNP